MPVIGTAGHVDHGKSSLIQALTGTNPDRLPEEVQRGMTIDLGFAHFPGPGGAPIGVIDVPGHERFIRNMVAGSWGLELALLCVAADDGWMRQTEDHTRVLRAMGVERLILVITKSDLAGPERLEQVRNQALERCGRLGYPAPPWIAVSARTGANIEALRELILAVLGPPRPPLPYGPGPGLPLLWVDRAFSVKGAGAVVTGTLHGGPVEKGQELLLLPQRKLVRVRGLESYFQEVERAEPATRLALNLHGIDTAEVSRGDCLSSPQARFWIERELAIRLQPPQPAAELRKSQAEVEIALGTGHRLARVHRLDGQGLFRVLCEQPSVLFWNQPCLLIRQGGSEILAGARVAWGGALERGLRPALSAALRALPFPMRPQDLGRVQLEVRGWVRRDETGGAGAAEAGEAGEAGLPVAGEAGEAGPSVAGGSGPLEEPEGAVGRGGFLFQPQTLERVEREILRLAAQPGGAQRSELAGKLGLEPEALGPVLEALRAQGRLQARGGLLFPPVDPRRNLSPLARQLLGELEQAGTLGLEPRRMKLAGARKELATLARSGLAVSLDGEIYYAAATYAALARAVLAGRAAGELLELAQAKEASGLSRKYLIPLLNRMELDGYVKREGDARRIRRLPD
jgi:selenocysteine-specific elongation factor